MSASPLSPLSPDSNDSWSSSIKTILNQTHLKMPITRNPSQRVRDWVRTGARSASADRERETKPSGSSNEIIHLGGSRFGTPTPESIRSRMASPDPITSAASVRSSGHNRANTTDSVIQSHMLMPERSRSNTGDAHRPVTNWFQTDAQQEHRPQPHVADAMTPPSMTTLTHSPTQTEDLRGELSPSPLRVANQTGQQSLSKKPSIPTISTTPPVTTTVTTFSTEVPLLRKNSTSKWKALPARPKGSTSPTASPPLDRVEEHHHEDNWREARMSSDAQSPRAGETTPVHVGQMIRADKHLTHFFPPPPGPLPAPPPPNTQPPAINVYGKICLEIPRPDSAILGSGSLAEVKSSDIKVREAELRAVEATPSPTIGRKVPPGKQTRDERYWLHKNYRGEVPFLRAWGLDIKSEEERAEGLVIMRELMKVERLKKERKEEEELAGRRQQQQQQQQEQDQLPLQVAMEKERRPSEPLSSPLYRLEDDDRTVTDENTLVEKGWLSLVAEVRASQVPLVQHHRREESETSVTDEYLNTRISSGFQ